MFPVPPAAPIIAIGGSRRLSAAGQYAARLITQNLLSMGASLVCGCATGTDAAVVIAASKAHAGRRLSVLCAFGPPASVRGATGWLGVGSASSPWSVARAGAAGARIQYWAGGGVDLPYPQRLANRTRAVARACTHGGIVLVDGLMGPGSGLLVSSLAARGLPVWVVPVAGRYGTQPSLPGSWVWCHPDGLADMGAWLLPGSPNQPALQLVA